ncbi:MAG TPA: FadD3 family acyl-CoA ligase [Acidimicrobiia bacterium]|nr:FadD3 family acyl-CoA ligase [Acidimicrobiia bacterium]
MRSEVTWPTIPAMVRHGSDRFANTQAVVDGTRRVDFATLRAMVDDAARALMASGIVRGDRVALWAPNSLEWIVAALGVTTAGGVLVPVNTRFRGVEAAYVLSRSGARMLFTVRGFLGTDYPALLASAGIALTALDDTVLVSGDVAGGSVGWDEFLARGGSVTDAELDARLASIGGDDPSDVVFTSGTTGNPKGVVMTHGQTLRAYLDWCDWADLRLGDRYLIANPFFHIFGYKAGCLACLMRGATIYPLAVFDPAVVLDLVEREHISVLPGPPTIYLSLLDHPDRLHRDLSSLRVAVTGAADIPVELIRRVRQELPFERILTGYGLTEAGTVTGSRPDDDFEHVATTVGVPWTGFEVRTVTESGDDAGPGEPGEVTVRGATVMHGYLDDPTATAAAIDADGWLHTGDLGTFDPDGYLRIVGRIKDMFVVGGFNAYPAEIENLLLRHPRVAQAAVIGVPDARLGEVGMAFLVLDPGPPLEPSDIIDWARGEMANFKTPRLVEFLDALPLNATGKVVKDELRARAVPR